jgi:hypothetical protein
VKYSGVRYGGVAIVLVERARPDARETVSGLVPARIDGHEQFGMRSESAGEAGARSS